MNFHAQNGIYASTADDDYDGMAHIICSSSENYWFSLSRQVGENVVEVMVLDQLNHKISGLNVTLQPGTLVVNIGANAASYLDGNEIYKITFKATDDEYSQIDAALKVLLKGTGTYSKL